MIASDLAARGLNILGVTHVFNLDVPTTSKAYLHRVGRTARGRRAGHRGFAAHGNRGPPGPPLRAGAGDRHAVCEGSRRSRVASARFLNGYACAMPARRYYRAMNIPSRHSVSLALLLLTSLIFAGCSTTGGASDDIEPTLIEAEAAPAAEVAEAIEETTAGAEEGSKQEEGEVPLPVAETEQPEEAPKEVVVQASRQRHDAIHDLVAEGQTAAA